MWKKHGLTLGMVFIFIGFLMLINSFRLTGLSIYEFADLAGGKFFGAIFVLAGIGLIFSSSAKK
jgi:hypothetical protein